MHRTLVGIALAFLLMSGSPATSLAQQAGVPQPSPDPGVNPVRLLDRDEIRITRVELATGAIRSAHNHDDVTYHVWVPVSGSLEITIEKDAAVAAKPGQAFFMTKGTQHWFRNTGTAPASVMEIFVKRSTVAAAGHQELPPSAALALAGLLATTP